MKHKLKRLTRAIRVVIPALAILPAISCVTHPPVQKTEYPGLYVPKVTTETVNERIPGVGKWAMTVNEGSGYAYAPEDGKVSSYAIDAASGRLTASGETFDPDGLTGAHRSLPLHTIVRVSRVDIEKSVVIRINDRAPKVEGRILEVTPKAGQKLELDLVGAAPCRIEVLRYPVVEVPVIAPATAAF